MQPNYIDFWSAFKASQSWRGLMAMARYSPEVEQCVMRLRVEIVDAIMGCPSEADIQEAIWRLMALIGSQASPEGIGELAGIMQAHGMASVYGLAPPG